MSGGHESEAGDPGPKTEKGVIDEGDHQEESRCRTSKG